MRQREPFRKTRENTLTLSSRSRTSICKCPGSIRGTEALRRSQEATDPQTDGRTERQAERRDGSSGVSPKGRRPSASGSQGEPRAQVCPRPLGYSYTRTGQSVKQKCTWANVSGRAHLLPRAGPPAPGSRLICSSLRHLSKRQGRAWVPTPGARAADPAFALEGRTWEGGRSALAFSLYGRRGGEGEGRRAHQQEAAAQGKRVGLQKNLTPRTKGNISVYFNSKMIPIFQAMSHLDESREYFCFPVLLYRGKVSEVVALPATARAGQSPTTRGMLPWLTQTPPRHRNRFHKHHNTGLDSVSLSGEEQEEKISF